MSSEMPVKRHRALWWALAAGALVLMTIVGMVLTSWSSAGEYIERERKQVELRHDTLRTRGVNRPRFFEPAEEGNSWDIVGPAVDWNFYFDHADDGKLDAAKQGLRRSWTEPHHPYPPSVSGFKVYQDRGYEIFGAAAIGPGDGETDRAIDLLAVGWGLADRMTVNQDLESLTIYFHWQRRGFEVLRRFLRIAELTPAHLKRLAELLDLVNSHPVDLREGFEVSDMLLRMSLLAALEKSEGSPWTARTKPELGNLFSSRVAASRWFRQMDAYLWGLEAPLKLRGKTRWEAVEEWEFTCFEAVDPALYSDIRDRTDALFTSEARATVHLQLARAAVAIARHIQDRGAPPASLEALVPAYLPKVPTDPHLEIPFRYRSDELDAVVYAHGFDGDDDGGRDVADESADGDLVWLVRIRIPAGK